MKQLILSLALLLVGFHSFGQNKKQETVVIKSSIQCGMCTDRLDNMFADYWAVKDVEYDLDEQEIIVRYSTKRTTEEEIRKRITEVGYDADEETAMIEPYLRLPACCQKGVHIKENNH